MPGRKHKRFFTDILVDLFTPDALTNKGRGVIIDMSITGMAIETESLLDVETELLVYIRLPNHKSGHQFFAEIVRMQDFGNLHRYGLNYTRISLAEKIMLFFFIRKWVREHRLENGENENKKAKPEV
ncbi:MAG: hypothetical protein A2252_07755 [Elusimicrobia bacterium RIFOXYA2_FULL_39_19]|nr:MAG: hypothetical protein A2252_07755 [Elusimicrobia bacterium RIFOXYA2_FULL_39_19]